MRHLREFWSDLGHPFMLRTYCLLLIAAFILLKVGKCNGQDSPGEGHFVIFFFQPTETGLSKETVQIIKELACSYDIDSIIGYAGAIDNIPLYEVERYAHDRAWAVSKVLDKTDETSWLVSWDFNPFDHDPESHSVRIHYRSKRKHVSEPRSWKQYKAAFQAWEQYIMFPYEDLINSNIMAVYHRYCFDLKIKRRNRKHYKFIVDYFRVPYFKTEEEYKEYYSDTRNNYLLSVDYKLVNGR